ALPRFDRHVRTRLHEVPHGPRLPAGQRPDYPGARSHHFRANEGQRVAGVGAGQHHRRSEAGWRQVLSHAMPVRQLAWGPQRRRSFLLGIAPAVLVLAVITIAPAIYLVLTSLTPLNLTLPGTAWDCGNPAVNYVDLLDDPRISYAVFCF